MKRIKNIICIVLLIALSFSFLPAKEVNATKYKATKYTSFKKVKKDYLKNKAHMVGISCAEVTLKTKYGKKKALLIADALGCSADCNTTHVFIKKGKKIYKIATIDGIINGVDENSNHLFADGGGTFAAVYKYKSGKYKKIKDLPSKDSTFMDKKQKMYDKYKFQDIEYSREFKPQFKN